MKKLSVDNIRNIIFGIEDSLVSTSGFLFGLATTSYETPQIFTSGIIIISVEAVSMGAGAFLTEEETKEIDPNSNEIKKSSSGKARKRGASRQSRKNNWRDCGRHNRFPRAP